MVDGGLLHGRAGAGVALMVLGIALWLVAVLAAPACSARRPPGTSEGGNMQDESSVMPASGPVPTADLPAQIAAADLIIAGTVREVRDAGGPLTLVSAEAQPDYDQLRAADIAVIRTLAGPHEDRLRVVFVQGTVPSRPWLTLAAGQTVLLSLRATGGDYAPVAPTGSPLPTLPTLALPPPGADRLQAVAHELEQVILTADPDRESELIVAAGQARAELPVSIDLTRLDTPALREPLRRAASVAVALAQGQTTALAEVPALFDGPTTPPRDQLQGLVIRWVSAVRTPAARPYLRALTQAPSLELARAASEALRQLHDPAALPDLVALLDHPDQQVRYQAVMGLAELEPGVADGGPAADQYRQNETWYLQTWKRWWQQQGSRH